MITHNSLFLFFFDSRQKTYINVFKLERQSKSLYIDIQIYDR